MNYCYQHLKEDERNTIYLEIFRPCSEEEFEKNERVLKEGLDTKESRAKAAELLGMEDEWAEVQKTIQGKTSQCYKEAFKRMHWEVHLRKKEFDVMFSPEGQHRLVQMGALTSGSQYDPYQPKIVLDSFSKDFWLRSGVFDKKELPEPKADMIAKAENVNWIEAITTELNTPTSNLRRSWRTLLSVTKNQDELTRACQQLSSSQPGKKSNRIKEWYDVLNFQLLAVQQSINAKNDSANSGYISPIERVSSILTNLKMSLPPSEGASLPKEAVPSINQSLLKFEPPVAIMTAKKIKKVESEEELESYTPKPPFLRNERYQNYIDNIDVASASAWGVAVAIHKKEQKRQHTFYPPYPIRESDITYNRKVGSHNKLLLPDINNTIMFPLILNAYMPNNDRSKRLSTLMVHWFNGGGCSFKPNLGEYLKVLDPDLVLKGITSNPEMATTMLLANMYNSCLFFDKNDGKFCHRLLAKLRQFEVKEPNIKEVLGKSSRVIFFIFLYWIFMDGTQLLIL